MSNAGVRIWFVFRICQNTGQLFHYKNTALTNCRQKCKTQSLEMKLMFIQDCRKNESVLALSGEKKGRLQTRSDKIWDCKFSKKEKSLEFSRLWRSRALDLSLGASRQAMKGHECDVATDKDYLEMTMKIGENILVFYNLLYEQGNLKKKDAISCQTLA